MNILFLTLQYDSKKEEEYFKKSRIALQAAANSFQNNLLSGFCEKNVNCQIMNTVPVATFPKYRQVLFNNKRGNLCGHPNIEIGFLNLPVLKQTTRVINYYKQIKKWIKNTPGEKCIIAYSLYLPFEIVLKKIKKKFPNVRLGLICPDLPCEFGILPQNKFKAKVQMSYGKKTLKYSENIDFFILLTEYMKTPLKVGNRPYTVVEGICNIEEINCQESLNTNEKIILYTGTLHKKFGISNLLDAFSYIQDENYRLWICGDGDMRKVIEDLTQKDKRIKFFGHIAKSQISALQQQATVLVNPRQNNEEFTKYSFPSKTMEYMASGKPVVMYKLDGIPDDYDEYLNYVEDDSAMALKDKIVEICSLTDSERKKMGIRARDFVLNEKSPAKQAQKIINSIEKN